MKTEKAPSNFTNEINLQQIAGFHLSKTKRGNINKCRLFLMAVLMIGCCFTILTEHVSAQPGVTTILVDVNGNPTTQLTLLLPTGTSGGIPSDQLVQMGHTQQLTQFFKAYHPSVRPFGGLGMYRVRHVASNKWINLLEGAGTSDAEMMQNGFTDRTLLFYVQMSPSSDSIQFDYWINLKSKLPYWVPAAYAANVNTVENLKTALSFYGLKPSAVTTTQPTQNLQSVSSNARYYCSARTGMMYQLAPIANKPVLDPTGQRLITTNKENILSVSKWFPSLQARTNPVEISLRTDPPEPGKGYLKTFGSADSKLKLTFDPKDMSDVFVSLDQMPTINAGDALAVFKYNMPGFVQVRQPYAAPDDFRDSPGYDEWKVCDKSAQTGERPLLTAEISVTALTTTDAGGDNVFFRITADGGAPLITKAKDIQTATGSDFATNAATDQVWAPPCSYKYTCKVEVVDEDGAFRGKDDEIGNVYVTSSQRGRRDFYLDDKGKYILSVDVKEKAPETQGGNSPKLSLAEMSLLKPGINFGDVTVYHYDTSRRNQKIYVLVIYETITRFVTSSSSSREFNNKTEGFEIDYMQGFTWTPTDNKDANYVIPRSIFVFDTLANRDAAKNKIAKEELILGISTLAAKGFIGFTSLLPTAPASLPLLLIVEDLVTTAVTNEIRANRTKYPGMLTATEPANPFLMVTRLPSSSLTGNLPLSLAVLQDKDSSFRIPETTYCKSVMYPVDAPCAFDTTKP